MYLCKIPTLEEMHQKWDFEIENAWEGKENWICWKERYISRFLRGKTIPYYGILDGQIICEATACIDREGVQNGDALVDGQTVYLCAFRTVSTYQNQGYFSRLFRYMTKDLVQRGYRFATVGVEPEERENQAIYQGFGFTEHILSSEETYPDGTKIPVDYYRKKL